MFRLFSTRVAKTKAPIETRWERKGKEWVKIVRNPIMANTFGLHMQPYREDSEMSTVANPTRTEKI